LAEIEAPATACPHDGTPLTPGLEGQVLGERYRITRELGEGGMGRVYLAEHVILGKQVAVKVLRAEYSRQPELVKRFQLEAVAASQIGQENIVDVSDFGRTPDNSFYFVMEYVAGKSLAQMVDREGPVRVATALPLLLQITKALGAAHGRGIIHRDLKPDNVLVTRKSDGTEHAKVLDFGISKVGEAPAGARITQVGMVVGTPHYMAPEQATGEAIDLRADIYAFGVLAYETITGKIPFDAENSLQILMKHQREAPVPPRQRRADLDIPERLDALIMSCLAKNREGRPQTMGDVGRELAGCMAELGMVSGPTPLILTAIPPQARASNPALAEARPAEPSAPRPQPVTPEPSSPRLPTDPVLTEDEARAVGQHRAKWPLFAGIGLLVVIALGAVVNLASHPKTEIQTVAVAPPPAPQPVPPAPPVDSKPPPPAVAAENPAVPVTPVEAAAPKPAPSQEIAERLTHPKRSSPESERVALVTIPAGAKVIGASGVLGSTPLQLDVPAGQTREVKLVAEGYRAVSRRVRAGERRVEVRLSKLTAPALPPAHLKPSMPPRHLKPSN